MDLQQDGVPLPGEVPGVYEHLVNRTAEHGHDRGQRWTRRRDHRPVREHGPEQDDRGGHEEYHRPDDTGATAIDREDPSEAREHREHH
eukprot:746568-Heterocapsa_arctica.AAC.1